MSDKHLYLLSHVRTSKAIGGADGRPADVTATARTLDASGLDQVLIGYMSQWADSWAVTSHILAQTERISILLAHRPGVVHPVTAARQAATLSYLSNGRLALNIVTGDPRDRIHEGDRLDRSETYARAEEYVTLMRRLWSSDAPVNYEGRYYSFTGAMLDFRPGPDALIPIHSGGASEAAAAFALEHSDVYMLWGEPLPNATDRVGEIRRLQTDRGIAAGELSMSFRVILGRSHDAAWERAGAILADHHRMSLEAHGGEDDGSRRLREIVSKHESGSDPFWAGITEATGGAGNTSALVGTVDEVAQAISRYHAVGISTFLLSGEDGSWTEELLPLLERIRAELPPSCSRAPASTASQV